MSCVPTVLRIMRGLTGEDPADPGRCVCCALPMASCGRAIAEAAEQAHRARARRERGTEIEARYTGICADCKTYFAAGALIEWDDEIGGWRALACCP